MTNEEIIAFLKPALDEIVSLDNTSSVDEIQIILTNDGGYKIEFNAWAYSSRIIAPEPSLESLMNEVKTFDPAARRKAEREKEILELETKLQSLKNEK